MNATNNAPNMVEQIIDPSLDAYPNWKAWAIAAADCMEEISHGTIVQTKIVWGMNPKYPCGNAARLPIEADFSDDLGNHLTRSFTEAEVKDVEKDVEKPVQNIIPLWGDWLQVRSNFGMKRLMESLKQEKELVL